MAQPWRQEQSEAATQMCGCVHDLDGIVLVRLYASGCAAAPLNRARWRDRGRASDGRDRPGGTGHALAPASLLACERAWVHGFG
jgi:hypothetical protein